MTNFFEKFRLKRIINKSYDKDAIIVAHTVDIPKIIQLSIEMNKIIHMPVAYHAFVRRCAENANYDKFVIYDRSKFFEYLHANY